MSVPWDALVCPGRVVAVIDAAPLATLAIDVDGLLERADLDDLEERSEPPAPRATRIIGQIVPLYSGFPRSNPGGSVDASRSSHLEVAGARLEEIGAASAAERRGWAKARAASEASEQDRLPPERGQASQQHGPSGRLRKPGASDSERPDRGGGMRASDASERVRRAGKGASGASDREGRKARPEGGERDRRCGAVAVRSRSRRWSA